LLVDGIEIRGGQHIVKLVCMVLAPSLDGESAEMRIVARLALPLDVARGLGTALADVLRVEGGFENLRVIELAQRRDKTLDN